MLALIKICLVLATVVKTISWLVLSFASEIDVNPDLGMAQRNKAFCRTAAVPDEKEISIDISIIIITDIHNKLM